MDIVVTAHDVTRPKPDPEPLLKALNYLGVEAASSILVGDSSYDILTGKNAGSRTLVLPGAWAAGRNWQGWNRTGCSIGGMIY